MSLREHLPLIPESKHAAVARALQAAFGVDTVEGATLLTGGLSSALVYRIMVGGRSYVLRVILQVTAFNDPARQYYCMQLASDAGIAPRVYYADADDALSISDFIDASAAANAQPNRGTLLRLLVETVQAIQSLPLFPALINFREGVDDFIARFRASGMLPAAATEEHFRYYAEIQRVYPRNDPAAVSSHNDLNPNNLIYDGTRLWVVDWESAFCNDRYADLANAATFFLMDAEEEEAYLVAYFGGPPDAEQRSRFFLSRQICRMFYAVVFLSLAFAQSPPGTVFDPSMEVPPLGEFYQKSAAENLSFASARGQVLFGKVLLGEMLRDMKTARFVEAIRCLEEVASSPHTNA